MLSNYVKIALRNLRRQKGYAFINIFGLSVGLTATILILLYAHNELTYDRFHEKSDRIYYFLPERITPTGTQPTWGTWVPLLDRLRQDYPAIVNGVRVSTSTRWVQDDGRQFEEEVTYADPSLFEVFTFPLAKGNPANPLPERNAVVLSPEIAQKYFGEEDPLGKVLRIDHTTTYTVTGVLKKVPPNTTIRPALIVPIASAPWYSERQDDWGYAFLDTYIELSDVAQAGALQTQFPALVTSIWDAEVAGRTNFKLLPLPEVYEALTGSRKYAYVLLGIAFGIILIACINFMNLATARSLERTQEIGMRKVLGALRTQLVKQFIGESLLMSLLALAFGVALAQLFLPAFNRLYQTELRLDLPGLPMVFVALLGLGMGVGLMAGSYPAFYLSRLRLVEALKGKFKSSSSGLHLRHSLMIVQFVLSVILIVGTAVMWDQVQYMKHASLGFDKENVVVLPVEVGEVADRKEAVVRLETFKNNLAQLSSVASVTSSSHIPGDWGGWFTFAYPEGGDEQNPLRLRLAYMDARYFRTYGINFIEGRDFIEGSEADRDQSVIINKAALDAFGWTSAVGKTVRRGDTRFNVVGVVEDYNFESLQSKVQPVLHFYRPPENAVHSFISVRIKPGDYGAALAAIREQWQMLSPTRAFEYLFIDENFARLYAAQDRLVAVTGAFSILAILIACLGLFGLVSLTVTQRTKEIGVRKVLGASISGIVVLLSKDFLKLVLIALVVASPLAYFAMDRWLEDFAYRIEVGPGVFLLAGALALVIALLTVSYQAVRAALADPVKSLRYE